MELRQFTGKIPLHSLCYAPWQGYVVNQVHQQTRTLSSTAWLESASGALDPTEQSIREEILAGLIADKGGEQQIGTAERILAEIIASDVSLLVTFNKAIDSVIQNNEKARANPKALAQLDGYKRPLVGSLSANLQRFGMEKVAKLESLQEIIEEMTEDTGTSDISNPDCPMTSANSGNDG